MTETEILDQARDIVIFKGRRDLLDMSSWHDGEGEHIHDCGTAHCLAGWAQCISKRDGDPQEIGRELLPVTVQTVGFFCSDQVAEAWLESRGYADDAKANAFRDCLVGKGWEHVTDDKEKITGGEVWADGSASVQSVTGGVVRAYGSASVQSVTGGEVWADGSASVQSVTGGVVRVRSHRVTIVNPRSCTVIVEELNSNFDWVEKSRTDYGPDGEVAKTTAA